MFSQNHVQQLLIGKASVSLTVVATDGDRPEGLATGEIGAFTVGGNRYVESGASTGESNAVAGNQFRLFQKRADGTVLRSDILSTANIEKVVRKTASAATEKLEYYGYNGTSGSIEALDENFYRIRLALKEGYANNDHGTEYYRHAIYKSDATATQAEIALGLVKNGNEGMSREKRNGVFPIEFKAISNVALASDFVFDATFEITGRKESKILNVAAATPTYNTGTALAVGDFLRIGTAAGATGGAVALQSDVYKVVSLPSTTTIELDRPLMTASGTYLIADGAITVIPAATGIAGNWGVGIAGKELTTVTSTEVGRIVYKKVDWVSGLEGSDNITYTSNTSAFAGVNVYEQIAELEWFVQGNEGNFYRKGYPMIDNPRRDVEDTTYETIDIVYNDVNKGLIGQANNRKVLTIAIPTSNPGFWTNGTDGLADVLGILMTGVPMYGGVTTTNGGAMVAGDLD